MIYAGRISPAADGGGAKTRRAALNKRGYRGTGDGPVRPSQTQSHLVVPSRAFNFPQAGRIRPQNAKIDQSASASRSSLATSHWPLATTAVKPSQTQSHLVKPSPTFNFPFPGGPATPESDSGQVRAIREIRGSPSPTQSNLVKASQT